MGCYSQDLARAANVPGHGDLTVVSARTKDDKVWNAGHTTEEMMVYAVRPGAMCPLLWRMSKAQLPHDMLIMLHDRYDMIMIRL